MPGPHTPPMGFGKPECRDLPKGGQGQLSPHLRFSCPQDKTPQVSEMETQNETLLQFSDSSLVTVTLVSSSSGSSKSTLLVALPGRLSPRGGTAFSWANVPSPHRASGSQLSWAGRLLQERNEMQHTRILAQGSVIRLYRLPSPFPCLPGLSPQAPLPSWGPG